jgi:DNA-binding transcriptional LysR family regulator
MKHLRALELITVIATTGSIRKSAARLNVVPSALTRQLQELEHEFGAPLFDRAQQGMRPTAAGELVLGHARTQLAGHDLLLSQLADLAGGRRGHVTIACSQAFAHEVLPAEIAAYQAQHPRIAFSILVRDHAEAVAALTSYEAELALVLQPPPTAGLSVLFKDEHFLCALMRPDHPLAGPGPVRLRDCLRFPVAMPGHTLAIRHLLDAAILRAALVPDVVVESGSAEFLRNYARRGHAISFQVVSGIPRDNGDFCARPIDRRDMEPPHVLLLHLSDRTLSVPVACFAEQLALGLRQRLDLMAA